MRGKKISLNYLAGLIDGEGFFTVNYRKIKQSSSGLSHEHIPVVGIHMTATKLITQIQKEYGGYIHKRMGTNRMRYDWNLRQAIKIYPFVKKILPYLRVKHPQAKLMIELCKTYKFFTKKKIFKLSKEIIDKRNAIKKEISFINKEQD